MRTQIKVVTAAQPSIVPQRMTSGMCCVSRTQALAEAVCGRTTGKTGCGQGGRRLNSAVRPSFPRVFVSYRHTTLWEDGACNTLHTTNFVTVYGRHSKKHEKLGITLRYYGSTKL